MMAINYLAVVVCAVLSMVVGGDLVWAFVWEEVDGNCGGECAGHEGQERNAKEGDAAVCGAVFAHTFSGVGACVLYWRVAGCVRTGECALDLGGVCRADRGGECHVE